METTNSNQPRKAWCAGIISGLVFLIIGLIIGTFIPNHNWRAKPLAERNPGPGHEAMAAEPAVNTDASVQFSQWDPIRQMTQMQSQIDQIFQQSFAQVRTKAATAAPSAKPGYSLSMDVRDLKDKYQVMAYLPDTKTSDVKVNLKGDELKVDVANKVSEKPTAKNGETAMTAWGNYEEVVPLTGPLKDSQMKVQRMPHELIISVPKA